MTLHSIERVIAPRDLGSSDVLSLEAFPEALIIIDGEDLSVCALNDRACDLLRVERELVIGMPIDTIGPKCFVGVEELGWYALVEPGYREQAHVVWPDGGARDLSAFVSELADGRLLLLLRDASERRQLDRDMISQHAQLQLAHEQLEQQRDRLATRNSELAQAKATLLRLNKELRRAQRMLTIKEKLTTLGQFAAGIAHEINNPLAFVTDILHELSREAPLLEEVLHAAADQRVSNHDDTERERCRRLALDLSSMLADSRDGVRRIGSLVRQVGIYSHMGAAEAERCELQDVVSSALTLFRSALGARARLEQRFEPLPPVTCVRDEINQIVVNLLSNAVQAIEPGSPSYNSVAVSVLRDGDYAVIEVRDSGCGIAPDKLARATEMFYTSKRPGEGTGMGLALSLGIAQRHGGTIELESPGVGLGTTARLKLPLEAVLAESPRPPRRPATSSLPVRTRGGRCRVLVVDDEPMLLRALHRRLSRVHDVTTADTPETALQMLARGERFDFVLVDVLMPTITGPELAARIVATTPELSGRIALMSGGVSPEVAAQVAESSLPLLDKPLDPAKLALLLDGGERCDCA
ncbi:MAG: response regulator [Myxococcales bacterium]|nr:response regulator [Myxococcales bacterium]